MARLFLGPSLETGCRGVLVDAPLSKSDDASAPRILAGLKVQAIVGWIVPRLPKDSHVEEDLLNAGREEWSRSNPLFWKELTCQENCCHSAPTRRRHEHYKAPMHSGPTLTTASSAVGYLSIRLLTGLPFESGG